MMYQSLSKGSGAISYNFRHYLVHDAENNANDKISIFIIHCVL